MPKSEASVLISSSANSESWRAPDHKSRFFRPELDVVRFLAFLGVFLTHNLSVERTTMVSRYPQLSRVWPALGESFGFGLDLFFCLSAFLICELLLREKSKTGVVDLKAFYIRRVLRIWPLYFFGLAIGTGVALYSHATQDLWRFGAYLLLAGNWFCAVFGWSANPMLPLWSISVEEQFYLVWPWLARSLRSKQLVMVATGFIVVSNLTLLYLGMTHADADHYITGNSLVQLQMFAAGLLVCLLLRGNAPKIPIVLRAAMIAFGPAAWFLAAYFCQIKGRHPALGPGSLIAGYGLVAVGCVSILIGFLGIEARFIPGWAVYLGKISFGLYVYHVLAMQIVEHFVHTRRIADLLLTKAVIFGLTILMAAISFRFLETPFLRLKHRFEKVESRPV